ncbi:hypothetical protein MTO96_039234 [Rhipicephalus appendiculatus]
MLTSYGSGNVRHLRQAQIKNRSGKHQTQALLATMNSRRRRQLNRGALQHLTPKFTRKSPLATLQWPCPTHKPKFCGALLVNENQCSDFGIKGRGML